MPDKDESKQKGGYARAEALTLKERKEIARDAALSRWDSNVPRADFEGDFRIGEKTISRRCLAKRQAVIDTIYLLNISWPFSYSKSWDRCFKHCRRDSVFFASRSVKTFYFRTLIAVDHADIF